MKLKLEQVSRLWWKGSLYIPPPEGGRRHKIGTSVDFHSFGPGAKQRITRKAQRYADKQRTYPQNTEEIEI